jgi:hypothetical protein
MGNPDFTVWRSPMRHLLVILTLTVLAALPAGAELTLQTVRADKAYYDPGAEAQFKVVVANPDAADATGTLRVELIRDVDTRKTLAEQAFTVPAAGQQSWTGSLKLPTVLGMALTATLLRNGQPFAQKSDYFNCARSVHQVLLFGAYAAPQTTGMMDSLTAADFTRIATTLRDSGGNCLERFAWAPSDFDDLTPDVDRWWSGQTSYSESKTNLIALINALHAQGVKMVTYGKAAAGGITGYERLRRRPDLSPYSNGRPWLENYSAAYLDWITALGPPHPGYARAVPGTPDEMEKAGYPGSAYFQTFIPGGGQNWCAVWYDCSVPEIAETGISELAKNSQMVGFDGVRFDGEFFASRCQLLDGSWNLPEKTDVEALNLALTQQMKKEIRAVNPHYLFGYNAGTDITWSIPLKNTPASFQEKCKDYGLIGNEGMAFPGDIPWHQYCLAVRREAEIVRYYGGHYATYAFNRSGNNLYNYIFQYALRAHQMVAYGGPERPWLNRSATRFSRLLWDDSLTTWRTAGEKISVSASRDLWWQDFAAVGDSPDGGTRYVIHLFNAPGAPTTLGKNQLPPEPATNVVVRWKDRGPVRHAWVVDMQATSVEAIVPDNGAFSIGDVPIWKILVVDVDAPKPPVTWEAPPPGAVTGPSASELQITPPPVVAGQSWRTVIEPAHWGGGESVAQRLVDPTATSGTAVMGHPGGPTGGMAYSYAYPRIPGHYRCTYRLKVADNTVDQPVFALVTSYSVGSPFPGVGPLNGGPPGGTILKATDFAKPNVYQSFTTEFDYADYGFMGCGVSYLGGVQGWWDNLVIDLVQPWTAQQLADFYKNFQRPPGLTKTNSGARDVLVVRGLYNRLYQIDDAIKALPDAQQFDAYTSYNQQAGTRLTGYQWDWKPLWDQSVIILADVETKGLNYGQVLMLSEWVKDGGGLLILGGPLTLGQDDNMARGWPLLLPVELHGPWELRKCDPPVRIAGFGGNASVMYRHMVTPKEGATVLLKGAGGEPLLVGKAYGQGRVAVFTGTVLGEAPAGSEDFWKTDAWRAQLTKVISWVAGK